MCRKLMEVKAPGLHFYTLNMSATTITILKKLGYKAEAAVEKEIEQ